MTVQKDVTKNIYVGNGSTRTFPFTFECPAEHPEYIKVYLMQDDGTALATSDYQLDMDARQITYPSSGTALPEGKKLVIMRELPLQQMMNLVNNGPYFAEDIETALDESIMALQQIAEKLNRTITMSVDIDGAAFVNEVPFEAGKSFRIADDGKSIVLTEDPARVREIVLEASDMAQAQAQIATQQAEAAKQSADSAMSSYTSAHTNANAAMQYKESAYAAQKQTKEYMDTADKHRAAAEKSAQDAANSLSQLGQHEANAAASAKAAEQSAATAQSAAGNISNYASSAAQSASEALDYRNAASVYAATAKNYSENVNLFTPKVSDDGVLSWTNKAGLSNPAPVNIKGAKGDTGAKGERGPQGLQGPAGNAATITIGNVTTSAPGTSAQVTNRGTSSAVVLDFVLPKGKDGADGGVTVDDALSDTSTNPVQNKVVNAALDKRAVLNKVNVFTKENAFQKGMRLSRDFQSAITWYRNNMQTFVASIDDTNYTGNAASATKATQDGAGNIITETYAKKADVSGVVKSVNGTKPDSNGNVSITVSGGSNVTVDTTLSATSTNPIANKTVYNALDNKLDKTAAVYEATKATQDGYGNVITSTYARKVDLASYVKTINNIAPDENGNVTITVSGGSNITIDDALSSTSTNAIQNKAVYAALSNKLGKSDVAVSAQRALQDGDGNTISSTYIKFINGNPPDTSGNVSITVSGGGGVSTSESNTWSAQQNFHDLMLNREKYTTYVVNGTSDTPVTSTMVYAVTGAFTLNLATLAGALSASQSSVFTAYFAANADYSLTISNAGKLKYVGSASDVAITSAGMLLNILMTKDASGNLTSIVQASKLS